MPTNVSLHRCQQWTTLIAVAVVIFLVSLCTWILHRTTVVTDPRPNPARRAGAPPPIHEFIGWSADRPRAVIYYLTISSRLDKLRDSITSLDRNFNNKFGYPIIIFYDESDSAFDINHVRSFTKNSSLMVFQKIRLQLPEHINASLIPVKACSGIAYHIGYNHMCRFHAIGVYDLPILNGVKYALRLDDDSMFLRPIDYDIFDVMRTRKMIYGYVLEWPETPDCAVGLWEAVDAYVEMHNLTRQFVMEKPRMFFNNFELSAVAFWRSEAYKKFARYIDDLGGIYYHRWGDSPLKTQAVMLFVPRDRVHHFSDIGYEHQGSINQ